MNGFVKLILAILIVLSSAEISFSQIKKGDKELSVAASLSSRKIENAEESWHAINVPIRVGIMLNRNLAIEPELSFSKYKDEDPGYILAANLAYNFTPTDAQNKLVPFISAGFGYANTTLFLSNLAWAGSEDDNWTVINASGGLKAFVREGAALRLEYRFQNFLGDRNLTYHNVFLGFSVFLSN